MPVRKELTAKLKAAGINAEKLDYESALKFVRVSDHYTNQVNRNRMSLHQATERAFTDFMGNNYHPSKPQKFGKRSATSETEVQS
jgi:hypothetical protein